MQELTNITRAGLRLRSVRERSALSLSLFAKSLFVSEKNLLEMEDGKIEIDQQALTRLFYEYCVSPLWVLVGEGEMLLVRQFIDTNSSIQSALEIGKSAVKMHTLQLSKIVKRLSQLEEETFKRNFIDTNLN